MDAIYSLHDFLDIMEHYRFQFSQTHRHDDFIFRGVSNSSWPLLPGIFREYSEAQKSSAVTGGLISGRIYSASEWEILAHFKKEACGFLTNISQNDDFTWLQYAQHYGVPTRLLDFTSNPLVAMYFCCQSESKNDGAIWIINALNFDRWSTSEPFCTDLGPDYTREASIHSVLREMRDEFDYDALLNEPRPQKQYPFAFIPPYIDQRMSAQSSRFMLWGHDHSALESLAGEKNWMELLPDGVKLSMANDNRFIAKIIIPANCKHDIVRELAFLNINEKSIFPGLDGLGRYLNKYYKNNPDDICEFV